MITAEEKREQMRVEYYVDKLREQLDQTIREADPLDLGLKFAVRTPRKINKEVAEILVKELQEVGYEAEAMADKDHFDLVIYLRWGNGV